MRLGIGRNPFTHFLLCVLVPFLMVACIWHFLGSFFLILLIVDGFPHFYLPQQKYVVESVLCGNPSIFILVNIWALHCVPTYIKYPSCSYWVILLWNDGFPHVGLAWNSKVNTEKNPIFCGNPFTHFLLCVQVPFLMAASIWHLSR